MVIKPKHLQTLLPEKGVPNSILLFDFTLKMLPAV